MQSMSLEATPFGLLVGGVASSDGLCLTITASESDSLAHARQPDLLAVTQSAARQASNTHVDS